nr:MAG TPA: hypothetical protein [Caudoviricetes sp.]
MFRSSVYLSQYELRQISPGLHPYPYSSLLLFPVPSLSGCVVTRYRLPCPKWSNSNMFRKKIFSTLLPDIIKTCPTGFPYYQR